MISLAQFKLNDILPYVGTGKPKIRLNTDRGPFTVRASSSRLECLRRNQECVRCLRKGNLWVLEMSVQRASTVAVNCFIEDCPWCALKHTKTRVGTETPHLNLYHHGKNGSLLLMTQDHIFPKHAGGSNDIENLQTMCRECNSYKGGMLPEEYRKVIHNNERVKHFRMVDGGSPPTRRLSSLHALTNEQANHIDCAAE